MLFHQAWVAMDGTYVTERVSKISEALTIEKRDGLDQPSTSKGTLSSSVNPIIYSFPLLYF